MPTERQPHYCAYCDRELFLRVHCPSCGCPYHKLKNGKNEVWEAYSEQQKKAFLKSKD